MAEAPELNEQAWADSVSIEVGGVGFRVPSRAALLINKRASGRPKDLEDVRRLELTDPDEAET